jgi:hypothetical protein
MWIEYPLVLEMAKNIFQESKSSKIKDQLGIIISFFFFFLGGVDME